MDLKISRYQNKVKLVCVDYSSKSKSIKDVTYEFENVEHAKCACKIAKLQMQEGWGLSTITHALDAYMSEVINLKKSEAQHE